MVAIEILRTDIPFLQYLTKLSREQKFSSFVRVVGNPFESGKPKNQTFYHAQDMLRTFNDKLFSSHWTIDLKTLTSLELRS